MKKRMLICVSAIAMIGGGFLALGDAYSQVNMHGPPPQRSATYDPDIELQTSIRDGFTYAVVGDIVSPLPSSKFPDLQGAFNIIRAADASYANFEMTAVDMDDFKGPYMGGFHAVPEIAQDLKDMGFKAVGRASNHQYDFGSEGALETNEYLERAGILYVGSGKNWGAAHAPRYLMTEKGRVGFVAVATSQPFVTVMGGLTRTMLPDGEAPGRAGVAQIKVDPTYVVPRSMQPTLDAMKAAFPTGGALYAPQPRTDGKISVMGSLFKYGDVDRPQFTYDVSKTDVETVLRSVREGKMKSDFLSFGIHTHEVQYPDKPDTDPLPGDFLQGLAHQVIDAGADAFVGTGVHVIRGIEIYKNRPIFYGLGEFYRQMDINRLTASGPQRGDVNSDPKKYESFIAVNRYVGGQLAEVKIYPIMLGGAMRMAQRGMPRLADAETSQRILKRLQDNSQVYGTKIAIDNNVGIIRVAASGKSK